MIIMIPMKLSYPLFSVSSIFLGLGAYLYIIAERTVYTSHEIITSATPYSYGTVIIKINPYANAFLLLGMWCFLWGILSNYIPYKKYKIKKERIKKKKVFIKYLVFLLYPF